MHKHAVTDQPILDVFARRWSPRAFAAESVPDDQLMIILEAARWAPSAFNEQPWRFMIARKEETADYERLLGCLTSGNQVWASHAPVLGLGFARKTYTYSGKTNRHARHDLGLASAQLITQAMALDLYVHLMAGIDAQRIRREFGVSDDFEPVTGIAIGYLGDEKQLPQDLRERELEPRERRPLDASVFSGSWGRPRYPG